MKIFDTFKSRTTWVRTTILILVGICTIFIAVLVMNVQSAATRGTQAELQYPPIALVEESVEKVEKTEPKREPSQNSAITPAPPVPIVPEIAPAVTPPATMTTGVEAVDLEYLARKNLLLPVAGIASRELHDSFYDARSGGRIHQALDIRAAAGTPVLATAAGTLKLHTSDLGGIMVYEIDLSGPYVYYYGHLQRYADDVYEGKSVNRGDVIGFVGDTGNAGPGNYHLHFGISKVAGPGKWSGGTPINPFPLLAK